MLAAFLRSVYHASFRAVLPIRCAISDFQAKDAQLPPAHLRFRVSESLSIPQFLQVGERCSWLIEAAADLNRVRRVLDFGCGCGRTLRWLLQAGHSAEFYGVDVDREAVAWCAEHHPQASFSVNHAEPPLPFPDGFFDVVYCLSVFTHLNETMQDAWIVELHRLLSPGGVVLISVHGAAAAAQLKPGIAVELVQNGFVHKRSRKLKGILPDWYHTTLHTPDYIERRLTTRGFEQVAYEVIPDGIQDVVTAKKSAATPNRPDSLH